MITGNFDDNCNYTTINYICGNTFNLVIRGDFPEERLGYKFDVIMTGKKEVDITIYEN